MNNLTHPSPEFTAEFQRQLDAVGISGVTLFPSSNILSEVAGDQGIGLKVGGKRFAFRARGEFDQSSIPDMVARIRTKLTPAQ